VAPAHVLDHVLMLLLALLLRPQDQEIHDDEDQDKREQRHHHVVAAAEQRPLGKGRRNEHETPLAAAPGVPQRRLPPQRRPKCARNITTATSIATPRPAAKPP